MYQQIDKEHAQAVHAVCIFANVGATPAFGLNPTSTKDPLFL